MVHHKMHLKAEVITGNMKLPLCENSFKGVGSLAAREHIVAANMSHKITVLEPNTSSV